MAKKKSKKKQNSRKKKGSSKKSFSIIRFTITAGLWVFFFGLLLTLWYAKDLPEITANADFSKKTSITFLDRTGKIITRYGGLQGETVAVFDLQPHTVHALLATEDRRFYYHHGIDPIGIARAMVVNLMAGRTVQGGSTLTQQLAKNLFLTHERSLKRKIQETLLALWLEREFTKDEILTAYINRVYFGSGAYGIDAAARVYFDKPATQLNLEESALIAGLLKAPSRYSPRNNPSLAKARTKVVLSAMADAGYIRKDQAEAEFSLPPMPYIKPKANYLTERYFTDWLMDIVPKYIGTVSENITVKTTLDLDLQKKLETRLNDMLAQNTDRNVGQAAILLINRKGEVLSMIGGKRYSSSQFNRITQAQRQPGSAFKPFIYLTAFQQGWDEGSPIKDEAVTIGDYTPKNFDDEYLGDTDIKTAFIKSLNTPAVRLIHAVTPEKVINTAQNLGISSPLRAEAGLALGASEVSPLEMTYAYNQISNRGKGYEIVGIDEILSAEETILYKEKGASSRYGDSGNYKKLIKLMEGVVEDGTGRNARLTVTAAGKTGTSQNYRDAWFIGFTDDYVGTVWMGNDDNTPMKGVTGGALPAKLWAQVMNDTMRYGNQHDHDPIGSGFFEGLIDALTGGDDENGTKNDRPSSSKERSRTYNQ